MILKHLNFFALSTSRANLLGRQLGPLQAMAGSLSTPPFKKDSLVSLESVAMSEIFRMWIRFVHPMDELMIFDDT